MSFNVIDELKNIYIFTTLKREHLQEKSAKFTTLKSLNMTENKSQV